MKILIVEPEASGHRMVLYTRLLVRDLFANGFKIQILTTQSATEHPSFNLVVEEAHGELEIILMDEICKLSKKDSLSLLWNQYQYYKTFAKAFRSLKRDQFPDIIYIVHFDYFDKILALLGSPFLNIPFSGMLMDIKHHRRLMNIGPSSRSDLIYEYLFRRILKIPLLANLAVIDECFFSYAKKSQLTEYQKICFVPDVGKVQDKISYELSRKKLDISLESFVVLVYGYLDSRKGIHELLLALEELVNTKIVVLLAGQQEKKINDLLSTPLAISLLKQKKIVISSGFHDDQLESMVFSASDAVWLGYTGGFYGSSGVLFQAGAMCLPVIATSEGLIGWLTNKYQLGIAVNPQDTFNTSKAIKELMTNTTLRKNFGINGLKVAQNHSPSNFTTSIINMLKSTSKKYIC